MECSDCRREVLEGERMLREAPRPGTSMRWRIGVLGTLAVAAVALFTVLPRGGSDVERATERGPGTPVGVAAPAIAVVDPADAASLAGPPSAFVWRPASGVSLYKLTVTDEQGHIVWTASTRDTLVRPPASLGSTASVRYFWYVDALRADGGAVTSGVHDFSIR